MLNVTTMSESDLEARLAELRWFLSDPSELAGADASTITDAQRDMRLVANELLRIRLGDDE